MKAATTQFILTEDTLSQTVATVTIRFILRVIIVIIMVVLLKT